MRIPVLLSGKLPDCNMRDLLFAFIYLAMVATPAVVALRSGRETGTDE